MFSITGLISKFFLTSIGKKLPPWAWELFVIVVVVGGGVIWHQYVAHKAIATAEQAGEKKAYANVAAQTTKLVNKANKVNTQAAQLIRSRTDAQISNVVTQYHDVFVRGPGKAACTGVAGLAVATGGHEPASTQAGATVDPLSPDGGPDLIALPFTGAAALGENNDALLVEDQAWRDWYTKFNTQWQAWNAAAAKARAHP